MFTKVLLLAVLAAFALCDETPGGANVVPIVSQEMEADPEGKYRWSYETGDGSKVSQEGELRALGEEQGIVQRGQFSYQGDDGTTYSVSYVADENGYQPVGEHLPVAPEVPAPIQKALEFLATAPPPKEQPSK